MQYALLIYSRGGGEATEAARGPLGTDLAAVFERPEISGWLRLYPDESATTMRLEHGKPLLTDGPFIDSKEFLGGLVLVEAENLDGAIAVAAELHGLRTLGAIEVRPIFESA